MLFLPNNSYYVLLFYTVLWAGIVSADMLLTGGKTGKLKRTVIFFEISFVVWGFSGYLNDFIRDLAVSATEIAGTNAVAVNPGPLLMGKNGRSPALMFGAANCLFYSGVFLFVQFLGAGVQGGFKKLWKIL